MKYVVFGLAFVFGVPLMALAATYYPKARSWLLSLLIATPVLGGGVKLNFLSMESYRGPDRGFEVTLADLIALALAFSLVLRDRGRVRWLPTNSLWMLAFFLVAVASAFVAPVGVYAGFTLWKMVRMYLVFWVVANLVRSGVELRAVWRGLLIIGLAMLGYVLKQKYLDGYYRIPGPFDHSNTIPLYLNVVIPPLVVWLLADPALSAWKRSLSLLAVFAMLFAVQATFSRAGLMLAGAGFVGGLGLAIARVRSTRVVLLSGFVLVVLLLGVAKALPSILERIRTAPPTSEAARDEFNHAASLMVADHPFGIGINSFSEVLTVTTRYNQHIAVMQGEAQAGVCHHIYWLTLAELGWPGLALFLIVIGRFLLLAVRGSLRGRSLEGMVLAGYALGFLCMHAQGFLEWAFRITPVTLQFSIAAGVVVGLNDLVRAGVVTPLAPSGAGGA
jgi:O-antigen ligase